MGAAAIRIPGGTTVAQYTRLCAGAVFANFTSADEALGAPSQVSTPANDTPSRWFLLLAAVPRENPPTLPNELEEPEGIMDTGDDSLLETLEEEIVDDIASLIETKAQEQSRNQQDTDSTDSTDRDPIAIDLLQSISDSSTDFPPDAQNTLFLAQRKLTSHQPPCAPPPGKGKGKGNHPPPCAPPPPPSQKGKELEKGKGKQIPLNSKNPYGFGNYHQGHHSGMEGRIESPSEQVRSSEDSEYRTLQPISGPVVTAVNPPIVGPYMTPAVNPFVNTMMTPFMNPVIGPVVRPMVGPIVTPLSAPMVPIYNPGVIYPPYSTVMYPFVAM